MTSAPLIIAIGGDHAGLPLKAILQEALAAAGHSLIDVGTNASASVDYPDYAHQVATAVEQGRARFGVLVCGSGIGMQIAANRHAGIRATVLHSTTEARLSRQHNDANIACFGARLTGPEVALDALQVFLATAFEGGRHQRRIDKINPTAA
ncbi:ribose 5-phosphate isomerase B [Paracraurococcus lichenis]|uniref:Ribose 5-phosphate isomerase B n=1 Tax=Paracraurococcus lichenis TaxID=3064888 RepID=A0ABT9DUY1_9PROT|nr:ribose 5-phosphate isomerase B [Paracraurococcus sp. LOR1-02]MDO9707707.1 ribose 5-phosphate isomerase B [Paracraurococcus sp. LOR1-02]